MLASSPSHPATFSGFRPELLGFLAGLRANNRRDWFQAHRADYEALWLEPARCLVVALGELLQTKLGADIRAEPKIYGSIMAVTRDTRFASDKTPYKTHLDLWFPQGDGPSRERPGYFVRLTEQRLVVGAGLHAFSADGVLERYRQAVLDPRRGLDLERMALAVAPASLEGRSLARVPRGFAADHPRADWLRHTGLYAQTEWPVPPELFTSRLADWCLDQFEQAAPLQRWLLELLAD